MELLSYVELHTVYLFVFSIGLGLGVGISFLSHAMLLFVARDNNVSEDEKALLILSRKATWIALLLYGIGGVGLFTLAYESMLSLDIFYASMTIALILIINELAYSFRHIPRMQNLRRGSTILDALLLESSSISVVSWAFLTLHHVIYRTDIGYFTFIALYAGVSAIAIVLTWVIRRRSVQDRDMRIMQRSVGAALALSAVCGGAALLTTTSTLPIPTPESYLPHESSEAKYSAADVALHNNSEDCWLIVDDKVFDVTDASRLHPALFNCGTDASVNYHKNHGAGIRDKMMQFYIGDLTDKASTTPKDAPFDGYSELQPFRELYTKEGSWDVHNLMLVVEKDDEKILAIDGSTHTIIGRIHDVGFQPHTSVFSSDGTYMYIISRDGWLTKINLKTLEPITSVRVGDNSRGTALTDNDRYVVVGNYQPGNLIILDASSMRILATIPLVTNRDGIETESRAGAVVEDGNRIIVALKDANSVWIIDTDKPGFPVTHRFSDIGRNVPALHDAFLTPDGKHYIVASQGSKTAWVLDLETMKPVAEIETGETPHTGPGATWGNYIYVPALGEGLITVIDTTTWKPATYIKTGGPGLFVRSYSKDPSYPYVWADTAFGDHKDEIYVIDARTNKIVETIIPVKGESSWHPEFTYNGKFVYVVSQSANEIEVYDAHTFKLIKRIPSKTPSAVSNVGLRIEEPGL